MSLAVPHYFLDLALYSNLCFPLYDSKIMNVKFDAACCVRLSNRTCLFVFFLPLLREGGLECFRARSRLRYEERIVLTSLLDQRI